MSSLEPILIAGKSINRALRLKTVDDNHKKRSTRAKLKRALKKLKAKSGLKRMRKLKMKIKAGKLSRQ